MARLRGLSLRMSFPAVMRNGQLCELAETEALFEAPRDPYTRELISMMPSL